MENLHAMAETLGVKRCWFHRGTYDHYDIPKRRFAEISARCTVVRPSDIVDICKGAFVVDP
jgi:hypothetical protein